MSDSIPSATADPEALDQSLPSNAEDRKAAAALSSLNTTELATDGEPAPGRSNAEQEALGKAMSRLEIASGQGSVGKKSVEPFKKEDVRRNVRIVAADVTFLADQLDVHRNRATELLRAQGGDVTSAMREFVSPSFGA
ncbi:uncharacterized protein N7469_008644 [Penicillium citrinum]|uniref:Nascent polypeptide-associated complex subunit alpha-like UBA domain-containing protein n=1 Tax=Penicillium citrinum TaxID=5077 RepID=A0A9W9NM00_PENCI|nr:uncharacterized protein N7469_008644 [Penicillium citrinum]KAJ5222404.1 hypothetical protein N7469_008644 [Penicillium citrinum]